MLNKYTEITAKFTVTDDDVCHAEIGCQGVAIDLLEAWVRIGASIAGRIGVPIADLPQIAQAVTVLCAGKPISETFVDFSALQNAAGRVEED